MTEPKLLTEAEWAGLLGPTGYELHGPELRERGLVALEPVDPDLLEAREIAAKYWEGEGDHRIADAYRAGNKDGWASAKIALAALKRGKELAQPKPLTREMVEEAYHKAGGLIVGEFSTLLHTALMEQMK